MKLSEAMRKGSKMTHQTFGEWTDGPGGCALMLAALGAGIKSKDSLVLGVSHGAVTVPGELMRLYPFMMERTEKPCPCQQKLGSSVWETILHLNDIHEWKAERIAGWIETHLETPVYSALDIQHYMEHAGEASHVG